MAPVRWWPGALMALLGDDVMPVPMEYRLASQNFEQFLAEVAEEAGLGTRNQAFTTTEGVLQCFRRRLEVQEAIAFAQILPAMLRALFVQDWDIASKRVETWDRGAMTAEVKALRVNHNFSPDSSIQDVARIVRRHIDAQAFDRCLERLPAEARAFWS